MFTGTTDYTPKEWAKFQQWLDRVYVDFTTKVAEGRNLPKEKVLEIAKGRIWSGEDAQRLGLVDALGGFSTALDLAKEAAKIGKDEDVPVVLFPRKKSLFETLSQQSPESSEGEAWVRIAVELARELRPAVAVLRQLGLADPPGVLTMPPVVAPEH
jgi:protease-4